MALRDLVAQSSVMAEEAIEKIVKDYVRYDPEAGDIAFTPEFAALGNKSKILVYLVALLGWSFVTEESVVTSTKPSDIDHKLGIPGGSLRPLLKDLKDRHLISTGDTGYSVRAASLAAIERELDSGVGVSNPQAGRRRKSSSKRKATSTRSGDRGDSCGAQSTKKTRSTRGIKDAFDRWIEEGFFDEAKSLAEVKSRFHEEAIIIPRTSIPSYLLKAVRAKSLSRRKATAKGKTIWVYQSK